MDISISHTKRGRGTCVCGEGYPCRYKPENCPKCDAFLGGSYKPKNKKAKTSCPDAVKISANLFSVKSSTRDDRCFVFTEGGSWICLHHDCKALRSTYSASGKLSAFRCKHIDKIKTAGNTSPQKSLDLTEELIDTYVGGISTKVSLRELLPAIPDYHTAVVRLTDSSYAVFGPPSATNTVGYCHIRVIDEERRTFKCTSKNCRTFVSKAKQAKVRAICFHLHLLYCCVFNDSGPPPKEDRVIEASESAVEHSMSRQTTLNIAMQRQLPYKIPVSTLQSVMMLDAESFKRTSLDCGWPDEFVTDATACTLCDGPLSQPRRHPGQGLGDDAFLLTELNAFKRVKVLVKFCENISCKSMHQAVPFEIGLFNISDKVLVSLDILLEIRELFKRGSPLTNVISAKLAALKLKSAYSDIPHGAMEYIAELMYNGFYCFEATTNRDLDSTICGICGICPEVLLGDGNEKNCCSNSQIRYEQPTSVMLSPDQFFKKLKRRWMERTVYTRTMDKLGIPPSQVPPLLSPSVMGDKLYNTETEKNSVHLKANSQPTGDPSMLHELMASGSLDMDTIAEQSHESLKEISKECKIPYSGKSKARLLGDISALHSSVLVGLCPCHGYSKLPGRTGGFYHLVCRHGCTFASKFLTLSESVRDAADLYMSLKFPPLTLISDSPCGFARHLDFRAPTFASKLWGENRGCFETPKLDRLPNEKMNFPEITPSEYREEELHMKDPSQLSFLEHPISGSSRRFSLGDRFHSSTNPHKSPLCAYHNINLCEQANTIATSMQESENNRKNDKRLRSACQQSFEVHYMYNFLMDFYQNEAIVLRQKRILEGELEPGESLKRNSYHRFVISDEEC